MVKFGVIFPLLLGLATLQTSSAQFDLLSEIFSLISSSLTPNDPSVSYTSSSVMTANLNTLATNLRNLIKPTIIMQINSPNVAAMYALDTVRYALPVVAPLVANIVTVLDNSRNNVAIPQPDNSVPNFITTLAGGASLTPNDPSVQYTSPAEFSKNLRYLVGNMSAYVPVLASYKNTVLTANNMVAIYSVHSFTSAAPLLAPTISSITNLLGSLAPSSADASSLGALVFSLLSQANAFSLVGNYIPSNTNLGANDPYTNYACGTTFKNNLDILTSGMTKLSASIISFISSPLAMQNPTLTGALNSFYAVMPYVVDLSKQIVTLVNGTLPVWDRPMYPWEEQINLYKSGCHLSYLQNYNARMG